MAHDSSPLPIRHSNNVPRAPPISNVKDDDDDDELAGDTIPCSPSAFMRDRDTFGTITTQPTQILGRSTLDLQQERSSSPASVIEVPASSPFQPSKKQQQQQQQQSRPLGSRLAPAGTMFRPPLSSTLPQKRPAASQEPEPISLLSDDEDDLTPPRGDIRPTTFKAQMSAFAYNPDQEERQMKLKLRQIFDVFGHKFPSEKVREALRRNRYDLEDTLAWLKRSQLSSKNLQKSSSSITLASQQSSASKSRHLSSKPKSQSSGSSFGSISRERPVAPLSPPKKPKRRLVQGLRKRSSASFSSPQKPEQDVVNIPSSDDPLIIDIPDDKEDEYQAERSPSPGQDEDKVLNCVNSSTVKELAAMTGMSEADLTPLMEKRPFTDLSQARKVSVNKKPGARKSARISIGESAVDAIEVFLNAVSSIDKVVAKCEEKAQIVKGVMATWDINSFGHDKRSARGTPEKDYPPTPTSLNGTKFTRPVIPRQPKFMDGHCQMKPFQLFGLNWMSLLYNYDIGCILADEMGLGKTCQVISLICHMVEEYEDRSSNKQRPWPNLIVVPPSTYENWLVEFERFAPELSVVGFRGSQNERAEIAEEVADNPEDYHVVLGTYSQITSETDIESLQSLNFNAAFFDEGHKMKNPETKVYKSLRRIPASWKMLLTGTPVQNNLLEMTSLLSFINPKLFYGYMDDIRYIFSQRVTIRDVSNGAFLYSERVRRARTILEPFILQRRKDQVLSDMPAKINTVVHCDMTDAQRPVYDEYETLFKMEPSQRAAGKANGKGRQNDQNNVWMQLRKAAIHPLLFRRHFSDAKVEKMAQILMDRIPQSELHQPNIKHLIQELKNSSDFELHLWCRDYPKLLAHFDMPAAAELDSGKVKKLLELIGQYQKNGDRVLVFSKFSRLIELLQEVLSLQGIEHRVLMGATDVSERQQLINEFNSDANIPVFLLTTGAGGTGINLTAANKVIIFDQSDNPQDDIQAENRAHRLGQRREVEIVRFITSRTIEELVYKACQKKIELANKVTGAVEEEEASGREAEKNMEKEVRKMMEEQMTPP